MKIEDNFVEEEEFKRLQGILMGSQLEWRFNNSIDGLEGEENKFQFIHVFYSHHGHNMHPHLMVYFGSIIRKLKMLAIYRIKANLLTRTPTIVKNMFHVDIDMTKASEETMKLFKTSIFYVNTNNGYTEFEDGTIVESVANRMVTFPSNIRHTGTSCTDEMSRVVVNFNYVTDLK